MASYQPVRLAFDTFEPDCRADLALAPILFLHGMGSFKGYWKDIPKKAANATKRKAYALDARNHGDSDWSDDFSFDLNAKDVIHFMDANGIDKAILVGQSMGGVTAIKAALGWPNRVEKIVVEDMSVRKIPKQVMDMIVKSMSGFQSALDIIPDDLDEEGAMKFILEFLVSNMPPEMAAMMKKRPTEDVVPFELRRGANGRFALKTNIRVLERAVMDLDSLYSDPSGVFEGPALFIYGKLSPFLVGADSDYIKQFFPNAVFKCVEDASHNVHGECPLEFTDAVVKFIS